MAKKVKRICYVDKTQYEYCPRCSSAPKWHFTFCCENCKNINYIIDEYTAKMITATEAYAKLEKCDLSNYKNFTDYHKQMVDEIKANAKKKSTDEKRVKKVETKVGYDE